MLRVTPYKDVVFTLDDEIVVRWECMNYAIITYDTTTVTTAMATATATTIDAGGVSAILNDEAAEITNDERWTDHHPQQQLEQQQRHTSHVTRTSTIVITMKNTWKNSLTRLGGMGLL